MRMHLMSGAAGLLLLAGVGGVAAQDVIVQPAQQEVVIQPEQQTVIREYVKKQPLASLDLPGFHVNIGETLPGDVELHAIDVPDVQYRYVVIDGQTVLVDPGTRKIIQVID